MRVVAGRWRGRRLQAPAGPDLRPTTDRVKEAIFSILGRAADGALVADLCCGGGGLGIEALSRGAAHACFVDRDRRALAAVSRNLENCGADPGTYDLVVADAVAWLAGPGFAPGSGPWLVLADPPYAAALAGELAAVVARRSGEGEFRAAMLEHGPDEAPAAPGLHVTTRRYGGSHLTILRPPAADPGEDDP